MPKNTLLTKPIKVITIGLDTFARDLEHQDVPFVHMDWAPPARGNAKLRELLLKLGTE